jgi:hypothetical protein
MLAQWGQTEGYWLAWIRVIVRGLTSQSNMMGRRGIKSHSFLLYQRLWENQVVLCWFECALFPCQVRSDG